MFFFVDGAATFDRNPFGRQTFGRQTFGRQTFGRQTFGRETFGRQTQIETCQPFDHLLGQCYQHFWLQHRTALAQIILNV